MWNQCDWQTEWLHPGVCAYRWCCSTPRLLRSNDRRSNPRAFPCQSSACPAPSAYSRYSNNHQAAEQPQFYRSTRPLSVRLRHQGGFSANTPLLQWLCTRRCRQSKFLRAQCCPVFLFADAPRCQNCGCDRFCLQSETMQACRVAVATLSSLGFQNRSVMVTCEKPTGSKRWMSS